MIHAIRTLVAKDLRERLRDKSFVLLGIMTPLVLAFIFNLVFGGGGGGGIEVRVGVDDRDRSEISGQLTSGLTAMDGSDGIEVITIDDGAEPDAVIDRDDLDAVIAIPEGFGEELASSSTPRLDLVENPDRPIQAGIAESIVDGLAADLDRTRLIMAVGDQLDVAVDGAERAGVELVRDSGETAGLDTGSRMVAGMAVMFVFFTVQFGVITLISERETGTMTRLLAAPIPRDAIMLGKGVVSFVLGVLATMILLGVATALMGASYGSWIGVTALVLGASLTAVALMAVVAGLAKTSEGAGGAQAIIAVGLALLGGSWFPAASDGVMAMFARLTPHYWFLDGLGQLPGASSWTVVAGPVAALLTIAVVAGVPAMILLRRRLTA